MAHIYKKSIKLRVSQSSLLYKVYCSIVLKADALAHEKQHQSGLREGKEGLPNNTP